jgi:hypothetical protein
VRVSRCDFREHYRTRLRLEVSTRHQHACAFECASPFGESTPSPFATVHGSPPSMLKRACSLSGARVCISTARLCSPTSPCRSHSARVACPCESPSTPPSACRPGYTPGAAPSRTAAGRCFDPLRPSRRTASVPRSLPSVAPLAAPQRLRRAIRVATTPSTTRRGSVSTPSPATSPSRSSALLRTNTSSLVPVVS